MCRTSEVSLNSSDISYRLSYAVQCGKYVGFGLNGCACAQLMTTVNFREACPLFGLR